MENDLGHRPANDFTTDGRERRRRIRALQWLVRDDLSRSLSWAPPKGSRWQRSIMFPFRAVARNLSERWDFC